jgi:hypothetical protein
MQHLGLDVGEEARPVCFDVGVHGIVDGVNKDTG